MGRGTAGAIEQRHPGLLCWVSRHFNASPALKIGHNRGFASVSLLPGEASLQFLAGVVSPSANMVEKVTQPPICISVTYYLSSVLVHWGSYTECHKLSSLNSRRLLCQSSEVRTQGAGWFLLRPGEGALRPASLLGSWGPVLSLRLHVCLFIQAPLFMGTSVSAN